MPFTNLRKKGPQLSRPVPQRTQVRPLTTVFGNAPTTPAEARTIPCTARPVG